MWWYELARRYSSVCFGVRYTEWHYWPSAEFHRYFVTGMQFIEVFKKGFNFIYAMSPKNACLTDIMKPSPGFKSGSNATVSKCSMIISATTEETEESREEEKISRDWLSWYNSSWIIVMESRMETLVNGDIEAKQYTFRFEDQI